MRASDLLKLFCGKRHVEQQYASFEALLEVESHLKPAIDWNTKGRSISEKDRIHGELS
jgi:hypothetical protein